MAHDNPDTRSPDEAAGLPGSADLPSERLAELAARLAQGFYDRDEVRADIVRRLLAREYFV